MLYKKNRKIKTEGFSLVEILIVMAMIAILSSAILVSISAQRDKARKSRVLVELSATIQPMMMCWSDGKGVNAPPSAGSQICNEDGYGIWPDIDDNDWNYGTADDIVDSGNWFISANDGSSYICCNSTYDRCAEMENATCASDTAL